MYKPIMKSMLEKGDKRFCQIDDFSTCKSQKIYEISTLGKKEDILPLHDKIKSDNSITCHFVNSVYEKENYILDILHKNANKGKAVATGTMKASFLG